MRSNSMELQVVRSDFCSDPVCRDAHRLHRHTDSVDAERLAELNIDPSLPISPADVTKLQREVLVRLLRATRNKVWCRTVYVTALILTLLSAPVFARGIDDDVVSVTTDGSGDATVLSRVMRGRVAYVHYGGGFDATADFTITCDRLGEGLWTQSNVPNETKTVAPSKLIQLQDGTDHTIRDYIWCVGSKVRIVSAQGGATKTAVFEIAVY